MSLNTNNINKQTLILSEKSVEAVLIKKYSSNFVLLYHGQEFIATAKAKKHDFVVGDIVKTTIAENNQARIIELLPRKSLVFRSDHNRSKLIASNVTQIFIVISSRPHCNLQFLNASLIFCESQQIKPVIIVNKGDLPSHSQFYEQINELYGNRLGYPVVSVIALQDISLLEAMLKHQSTVLIGQSGVGKSTITGNLLKREIKLGDLSSNGKGCHTTTSTTLYKIDDDSSIIDSSGLDNFGIHQINRYDLSRCFIEFRPYIPLCKFRNCLHLNEPECAVLGAIANGNLESSRYKTYLSFLKMI